MTSKDKHWGNIQTELFFFSAVTMFSTFILVHKSCLLLSNLALPAFPSFPSALLLPFFPLEGFLGFFVCSRSLSQPKNSSHIICGMVWSGVKPVLATWSWNAITSKIDSKSSSQNICEARTHVSNMKLSRTQALFHHLLAQRFQPTIRCMLITQFVAEQILVVLQNGPQRDCGGIACSLGRVDVIRDNGASSTLVSAANKNAKR